MFIRGPNPIWFMNNLTGSPLDDTYYAFFLTNDLPYLPQAVYQDPNGTIPWSDPIEFQPSGGLPNNLYFNPIVAYRIEIRQGPTQSSPLIWLIENYEVEGGGGGEISDAISTASNMITNPQFADILFVSGQTYTTAQTIEIGPGWNLILMGSGSTTLTQNLIPGSSDIQGNPPYSLTINSSGWTSVLLQQIFENNGAIFGGGAIAMAITAFATGSSERVVIQYVPSIVTSGIQNIMSVDIQTGGYAEYYGLLSPVNPSTNSSEGENAYVNININLPTTGNITITNIQLLGQSVPVSADFQLPSMNGTLPGSVPLFQEITYERVVDQEFHFYRDSFLIQPKASILTGWNFPLNPWQFTNPTLATLASQISYTADQTIIYQRTGGSNVSVGRGGNNINNDLIIQAVTNTNIFAVIQYIDASTMNPYWGSNVSALVKAALSSAASPITNVPIKMRLSYNTAIPMAISATDPISSWDGDGNPVFNTVNGWSAGIAPINDPAYALSSSYQDFPFGGFQLPVATTSTMTLAVVLYTTANMSNVTPDSVLIDQINLVPNEFALESNPITFNEEYVKCEYYYSSTFPYGVVPHENAGGSGALGYNAYANGTAGNNSIIWNFPTLMRTSSPAIVTYNPNSNNNLWWNTAGANSGAASLATLSNKNVVILNPQAPSDNAGNFIYIHVSADGRLGI